jgi:hypothetical protein
VTTPGSTTPGLLARVAALGLMPSIEALAEHEATHVVVAMLLGLEVANATIVPQEADGGIYLGRTNVVLSDADDIDERKMIFHLAPPIQVPGTGSWDRKLAGDLAPIGVHPDRARQRLAAAEAEARRLLGLPGVQEAIADVAEALLAEKTLDGARCREIVLAGAGSQMHDLVDSLHRDSRSN